MKRNSHPHKKIIYRLDIQDIQNVAEENFGRKLSFKELDKIVNGIGDRITAMKQFTILLKIN
ncbi:MAG TPA: hypothetical protein VLM39_00250 [Ignavibacteriaceae bacterium]|nr:hypothetical protein [Ignavibacteriaceae bacterium]